MTQTYASFEISLHTKKIRWKDKRLLYINSHLFYFLINVLSKINKIDVTLKYVCLSS